MKASNVLPAERQLAGTCVWRKQLCLAMTHQLDSCLELFLLQLMQQKLSLRFGKEEESITKNMAIPEMKPKLKLLNLVLHGAGVGNDIATVHDRKRVQKAVYLVQRAGVDLGYRYGWYKMGPYSPYLTRDYYELAEALALDETVNGSKLGRKEQHILSSLRPLFARPTGVTLSDEAWLELLASVDYLRYVKGLSEANVAKTIRAEKPTLFPYLSKARQRLRSFALEG